MQDGTFKGSCPRGWTRGSPTSTGCLRLAFAIAGRGGRLRAPTVQTARRSRSKRSCEPPRGGIRKKDGSEAEAIVAERSNELLRRPACYEVLPLQVGIIRPDPVGGDREGRRHTGDVLGIDPDPSQGIRRRVPVGEDGLRGKEVDVLLQPLHHLRGRGFR